MGVSFRWSITSALAIGVAWPSAAGAWLFGEHTEIGRAAVARLRPAARARLDAIWKTWRESARTQTRLCPSVAADIGTYDCIDFPMLAAIAGDHSRSPDDLTKVLASDWLGGVLKKVVVARNAIGNPSATRAAVIDAWRSSHIELQKVDIDYVPRAQVNTPHFLLPRAGTEPADDYLRRVLTVNTPTNAIGTYGIYHVAALGLARPPNADVERLLMAEAYALHFLQDGFSAGHAAVTGDEDAVRMGTHDLYCAIGLDTINWKGEPVIAFGDAHMGPGDLDRAASAVADSLEQLACIDGCDSELEAAVGDAPIAALYAFDQSKEAKQPAGLGEMGPFLHDVFRQTLIPAPAPEIAPTGEVLVPLPAPELAETIFGRFSSGVRGWQSYPGMEHEGHRDWTRGASLYMGVGGGYTARGVSTRDMDGTFWIESIVIADAQDRTFRRGDLPGRAASQDGAWVPRFGLGLRVHVPFRFFPLDTLLLAGYSAGAALWRDTDRGPDDTYGDRLVRHITPTLISVAEGGALRLQRINRTEGRSSWQFVLGRDFGVWRTRVPQDGADRGQWRTTYDLPVVEFRPAQGDFGNGGMSGVARLGFAIDRFDGESSFMTNLSFELETMAY